MLASRSSLAPGRRRVALRPWASGVLAGLLLAIAGSVPAAGTLRPAGNLAAPPLELRNLAGEPLRLDAFRGRTVLVNFWATWCVPCVVEMPSMARLRNALRGEGFEIIAVNVQENAARIRPFVERLDLDFPVVRDHDGSARQAWNVRVFPSSFVVDPTGRLALVAVGEIDWDEPGIIARVREVMRRPGASPLGARAALDSARPGSR